MHCHRNPTQNDHYYTGQEFLQRGGLVHLNGRIYDPMIGRMMSIDPVTHVYDPQNLNPYAYVENNPINATDPTGFADEVVAEGEVVMPAGATDLTGFDDEVVATDPTGFDDEVVVTAPRIDPPSLPTGLNGFNYSGNGALGLDAYRQHLGGSQNSSSGASLGQTGKGTSTSTIRTLTPLNASSSTTAQAVNTITPNIPGMSGGNNAGALSPGGMGNVLTDFGTLTGQGVVFLATLPAAAAEEVVVLVEEELAAEEAAPLVKEGIYEFTSASSKTYVGQSGNIAARLDQHLASGKLLPGDLGSVQTTEVLGGQTSREIAEQLRINQLGGVQNLENVRNPIGPARQSLLPANP